MQVINRFTPPPQKPQQPGGLRPAIHHICKEVVSEAFVGAAYAGVAMLGDSLGHPLLGRAAVAALGAVRGVSQYRETATAALADKTLGTALALTLGASTASLAGFSGNVMIGAAVGGMLGLVKAPRSFPG